MTITNIAYLHDEITIRYRQDGDGFEITAPLHPDAAEVDLNFLQQLFSDQTLVTLAEIGEMCGGANKSTLSRWKKATEIYISGAHRVWPPETSVLRGRKADLATKGIHPPTSAFTPVLADLPPDESVLPPPAIIGDPWSGQTRWYKGDIYRWGMRVRRIGFDGKPRIDRDEGRDPKAILRRLARRRRLS